MRTFKSFICRGCPLNLDRLQKELREVLSPMVGSFFEPIYIAKAIGKLGDKYHFSVSIRESDELESGEVSVVGYYDQKADKDRDSKPIELIMIFSEDIFDMAPEKICDLVQLCSETLAHEHIHARQARSRNFKPANENEYYLEGSNPDLQDAAKYLANEDEIEAHAFNIAGSLLRKFGSEEKAQEFLRNPKCGVLEDHHFDSYLDVFGKEHRIMTELDQRIEFFMKERLNANL